MILTSLLHSAFVSGALISGAVVTADEIPAPDEYAAVRAFVAEQVGLGVTPSVSLAVVRGGRLVWAEGFGLADVEKGREARADSVYLLASISKTLVATGLMTLVDQELVDLDAPVNALLPGAKLRAYRGDPSDISLRRLANHTAGLAEHWSFFYGPDQPPPFDFTLRRYGFAHRAPGTAWEYSNLAFGVIDHVLESVANEAWDEYLIHNVFDPAGMWQTGSAPRQEDQATAQYSKDVFGDFVRLPRYGFDHPGASALWSSALDLARFAMLHNQDGQIDGVRVISEASARAMRVKTAELPGGGRNGIAWFVGREHGQQVIQHSGGMPGVSTVLRAYPETQNALVVLSNSGGHPLAGQVADQISAVLSATSPRDAGAVRKEAAAQLADVVIATLPAHQVDGDVEASENAAVHAGPEPGRAILDLPSLQSLEGRWSGHFHHFAGRRRMELVVEGPEVSVKLGASEFRALSNGRVQGGELRGSLEGRIAAHEAYQGTSNLSFRLRLEEGDVLAGVCVAYSSSYSARPHWVELERVPSDRVGLNHGAQNPAAALVQQSFFTRPDAPPVGFVLPTSWKRQTPENRMRLEQYEVNDAGLLCIVYFFGDGGGGPVQANIDRWVGQFEVAGEPTVEEVQIREKVRATFLDLHGTQISSLQNGRDPDQRDQGWRMLAAVLELRGGPLFIKLVGPADQVDPVQEDFDVWVRSFQEAN